MACGLRTRILSRVSRAIYLSVQAQITRHQTSYILIHVDLDRSTRQELTLGQSTYYILMIQDKASFLYIST
jgi:hypothetical protein